MSAIKQIVELTVFWKRNQAPREAKEIFLTPGYDTQDGAIQFLIRGTDRFMVIPLCNIQYSESRWVDPPEEMKP